MTTRRPRPLAGARVVPGRDAPSGASRAASRGAHAGPKRNSRHRRATTRVREARDARSRRFDTAVRGVSRRGRRRALRHRRAIAVLEGSAPGRPRRHPRGRVRRGTGAARRVQRAARRRLDGGGGGAGGKIVCWADDGALWARRAVDGPDGNRTWDRATRVLDLRRCGFGADAGLRIDDEGSVAPNPVLHQVCAMQWSASGTRLLIAGGVSLHHDEPRVPDAPVDGVGSPGDLAGRIGSLTFGGSSIRDDARRRLLRRGGGPGAPVFCRCVSRSYDDALAGDFRCSHGRDRYRCEECGGAGVGEDAIDPGTLESIRARVTRRGLMGSTQTTSSASSPAVAGTSRPRRSSRTSCPSSSSTRRRTRCGHPTRTACAIRFEATDPARARASAAAITFG